MSEKMIENNKVSVIGKIVSGFTFSHEVFGEGFYMVDLEVNRLSEQADIIPLMISERWRLSGSSVPITAMKGRKTSLFFPYLSGKFILWKNLPIIQRQIRSFWTDTYVSFRFTGKRR